MQLVELNKSTYQYGFIDIKSEEKGKIFCFKILSENSDGNKNLNIFKVKYQKKTSFCAFVLRNRNDDVLILYLLVLILSCYHILAGNYNNNAISS